MKIDPYKLLLLRKAGYTRKEIAYYFDASPMGVRSSEKRWANNGIGEMEKIIIDSAEVYGAVKALELLDLKRLVDKFVKEREENGTKCSNTLLP